MENKNIFMNMLNETAEELRGVYKDTSMTKEDAERILEESRTKIAGAIHTAKDYCRSPLAKRYWMKAWESIKAENGLAGVLEAAELSACYIGESWENTQFRANLNLAEAVSIDPYVFINADSEPDMIEGQSIVGSLITAIVWFLKAAKRFVVSAVGIHADGFLIKMIVTAIKGVTTLIKNGIKITLTILVSAIAGVVAALLKVILSIGKAIKKAYMDAKAERKNS